MTLSLYERSLGLKHGKSCMPCSANFSMTLQTEKISTEAFDFLKQIVILNTFNSAFSPFKTQTGKTLTTQAVLSLYC